MTSLPTIGFIGLGEMGGPMARNLMLAGYAVIGFDLDTERLAALVDTGIETGRSIADVVRCCDVIATSLPSSSILVSVAENQILPAARHGQIMIDFGTVSPPETRRLAARFAEEGIDLLDVPVSGGGGGAQKAQLLMFVGGKQEIVERCRPILETVGGSDRLTYCGPAGAGQAVKGVNQLMMGLGNAAYLEAISAGVNEGVDINVIEQAIGSQGRWHADLSATARQIAAGDGLKVGVKFRELPYFLHAAQRAGYDLPMTKAVRTYIENGDRVTIDDHREAPSYWHELTHRETQE